MLTLSALGSIRSPADRPPPGGPSTVGTTRIAPQLQTLPGFAHALGPVGPRAPPVGPGPGPTRVPPPDDRPPPDELRPRPAPSASGPGRAGPVDPAGRDRAVGGSRHRPTASREVRHALPESHGSRSAPDSRRRAARTPPAPHHVAGCDARADADVARRRTAGGTGGGARRSDALDRAARPARHAPRGAGLRTQCCSSPPSYAARPMIRPLGQATSARWPGRGGSRAWSAATAAECGRTAKRHIRRLSGDVFSWRR